MITSTDNDLAQLKASLQYCKMGELRDLLNNLNLPDKGKKGQLIQRILVYLETGEILKQPKIPAISRAQKGKIYPLHSETQILKGSYLNDLKTRNFFKSLIGDHFHFTAFGIDWINARWLDGNPPTYQEYAQMWIEETNRRKHQKASPKEEWAYINYTQHYLVQKPSASHQEIIAAWKIEQQKNVAIVKTLLSKLSPRPRT